MFAFGDDEWPGVSKLTEECGELLQVLGKLGGSRGKTNHWSGDLIEKLHEEMGDVLAALAFVRDFNPELNDEAIHRQRDRKYVQFVKWHLTGDPLDA